MKKKIWLWLWTGSILFSSIFCGAKPQVPTETPTIEVPPTATPFIIPPPPETFPEDLPESGELRSIVEYANALNPWLTQAGRRMQLFLKRRKEEMIQSYVMDASSKTISP